MKLSQKGLDLICSFEGYLTKQPDGSCKAYKCPAGVWTCGWGCTEGVNANTHWTREEADRKFAAELGKFERAVERLVKVELNQNQFDALVSFSYNCGEGALQGSSLLKKLNNGDYAGACKLFAPWDKANVYDKKLKRRVKRSVRGLTRRRAAEAALFATRAANEAPGDEVLPLADDMPQEVLRPSAGVVRGLAKAGGAIGIGGGAKATYDASAESPAPETAPVPIAEAAPAATKPLDQIQKVADQANQMQAIVSTGSAVKTGAMSDPILWAAIGGVVILIGIWSFVPTIKSIKERIS